MKCRCRIEGIFCIVRDNTEYELLPQWFFTSPEIDTSLARALPAWNTNVIALKLEAYGITECNVFCESTVHTDVARQSYLLLNVSEYVQNQGLCGLD